eukprot:1408653-Rhodomonas_salina.9
MLVRDSDMRALRKRGVGLTQHSSTTCPQPSGALLLVCSWISGRPVFRTGTPPPLRRVMIMIMHSRLPDLPPALLTSNHPYG